jgi:hypothetical protein
MPLRATFGATAMRKSVTRPGPFATILLGKVQPWGTVRSLCQTRSRITATSVMPSAARLGTSTAAPEAKARIATQSNGLSTKRGTIRPSFPNDTPTDFKPVPFQWRPQAVRCLRPKELRGQECDHGRWPVGWDAGTAGSERTPAPCGPGAARPRAVPRSQTSGPKRDDRDRNETFVPVWPFHRSKAPFPRGDCHGPLLFRHPERDRSHAG